MAQNNTNNNFRKPFKKKGPEHRINDLILSPTVRVVGDNIVSKVCSIQEALAMAAEQSLDLVEIVSSSETPVCRIVDYQKFLYEKKKKEKEIKKGNKNSVTKEIKLGPNIHDHDIEFKARYAINFLKQGMKVKLSMYFRAREIAFKDRGEIIMLKFIQQLEEYGKPEYLPKMEANKTLYAVITPKGS